VSILVSTCLRLKVEYLPSHHPPSPQQSAAIGSDPILARLDSLSQGFNQLAQTVAQQGHTLDTLASTVAQLSQGFNTLTQLVAAQSGQGPGPSGSSSMPPAAHPDFLQPEVSSW